MEQYLYFPTQHVCHRQHDRALIDPCCTAFVFSNPYKFAFCYERQCLKDLSPNTIETLHSTSLIRAMIDRVETIETGEATAAYNNSISALASLKVRFTGAMAA